MMKLTKAKIEQFAIDVMNYLVKHDLDSGVSIYFNDKRMRNEYDWHNPDTPPKTIIEENIDPHKYFEYAAYAHILSMSFEGPLYDSLNYTGYKEEGLRKIFEKYGVYWELGNSWNLSAYPIDDDMEVEVTFYNRPKQKRNLCMWDKSIVPELRAIMDKWYELSEAVGDKGSCVICAGFEFEWNDDKYFMNPCSPWQGSISWETNKDDIRKMLEDIGATNIIYKWGVID